VAAGKYPKKNSVARHFAFNITVAMKLSLRFLSRLSVPDGGRAALVSLARYAQTNGTIEIVTPLDDARFNPGTNIVLRA